MKKTQGERLIALLKQRPMTTMELLKTGISTCPWKRIAESMPFEYELKSIKRSRDGLNLYWVVRTSKPKTVWIK